MSVEFHPDGRVIPVEYKNGPRRERRHDDVQLCAQALCLEEMLSIPVETGAVYSLQTHRRRDVPFTDELRDETLDIIAQVRAVQQSDGPLPPALNDTRCPPLLATRCLRSRHRRRRPPCPPLPAALHFAG